MKRRTVLGLLAASSLAGRVSFAQEIVPRPPQRVMLTIAGITAATNASALGTLLATLVVGGVPLNLVVETGDDAEPIGAESEIGSLLLRYAGSFPGMIEIVASSPNLGQLAPYQAARAAHDARKSLFGQLYATAAKGLIPRPLLTIACKAPLDSKAASATLAAGFRTVIELPAPPPISGRHPGLRSMQGLTSLAFSACWGARRR